MRRCRFVAPRRERAAVVGRREHAHRRLQKMQPLSRQPQIRGDLRIDRQRVRQRRHAEAGRDLARDGAAADLVARFEHDDFATRPREVGRGDQAVVASADDGNVVARRHQALPPFSTASAALRLRAPMIAPGCVADRTSPGRRLASCIRPARHRAEEEQLLERQLALEDVAFAQAPLSSRSSGVTT